MKHCGIGHGRQKDPEPLLEELTVVEREMRGTTICLQDKVESDKNSKRGRDMGSGQSRKEVRGPKFHGKM